MPRTSSSAMPAPRFAAPGAPVTDGAALTFEAVPAFEHGIPPLRIQPDRATLLRLIGGALRLTLGDETRVLMPGDEAIIPAARPHRLSGVAGEARVVMGFRSAPLR